MKAFLEKYFKGDPVIWVVMIILSIYSVLAVFSSTGTLAYKSQGGDTTHYLVKHSAIMLIGIIITYLTSYVPYIFYARISRLLYIIVIPLLVLTLMMGANLNEASRWLTLPGGVTFQTSDFAKLALILFVARILSKKQNCINDYKAAFRPVIIATGIICLLIFPANFSTSAMIFLIIVVMMFIGRVNIKHILLLFGSGIIIICIFTAILFKKCDLFPRGCTWKVRIESFLGQTPDESDNNFQAEQSKIAISTGGIFGKGPGHSTQRNFLPHPYSDFIFSIIVEEYGLLFGALPIIGMYLFLIYRAGVIVRKTQSSFAALMAVGLTFSLVFHAFINMAVAVNIFPVTGQTLPLVSMGGTSILFTSVALGILLSVSRTIREKEAENETAEATA
ncbi:MAG: FtsW/RodA/SpoVE family cell cycle protein [Bacteroidia bacterium]|nr:FtsW/RodA/SpoVE family cell cycle protein [Bacteroidia bacterium]